VRHGGHDHAYYTIDRGPAGTASVMLMHEFPGISGYLVEFAEQLADHFRVVVPSIVGRDGDPRALGSVAQLCVRREVHAFKTGATSPAVPWLRHLLETQVSRGEPCGVIGMCLSGGFALALSVNPVVRAAVVAQPATPASRLGPIPLPSRRNRAADLGLSSADRQQLAQRAGAGPTDLCARGYRFAQDRLSPPEKLAAARRLMGEAAMTVVTLDEPDPTKHSTLTGCDRNQAAILEVTEFLCARLLT
jgi:dienelactone hydrolase